MGQSVNVIRDNLLKKIKIEKPIDVVTMHDFFLDRFVTYTGGGGEVESFIKELRRTAEIGGGALTTENRQQILRGGKAFNSASALGALGARVHFFGRTSPLGLNLMKYFLEGKNVDLSLVRTDGEMAMTTALEMKHNGRMFNGMISYLGSVGNFGFDDLTKENLEVLKETDYLLITDWSYNLKGTDLAEKVFRFTEKFPCIKFFDPGDPTWRPKDIPDLIKRVFLNPNFNILGVNENEALNFASYFYPELLKKKDDSGTLGIECASILAEKLNKRVDVHTPEFSATLSVDKKVVIPTFNVEVLRVTGAGDCWQAGNAYGELIGLEDEERLMFANALAGYYISNPIGKHGSIQDMINFISTNQLRDIKGKFT